MEVSSRKRKTFVVSFGFFFIFRTTIKTRIILKRLLSNALPSEPPVVYAQQHSVQIVQKDDEQIDEEENAQRQKFSTKEAEVPERFDVEKEISSEKKTNESYF